MYQSISEGFTLDVLQNYTTFKRYFKVKQINDQDLEISSSKGKKELVKYVDSHELTIQNKVGIILDHFINKGSREIQGKARGMIVVPSRIMCVKYFFEINKQLKERGMTYQSLVGFSGEVSLDGQKYTEEGLNLSIGHDGSVPFGLKNPKYRLLVVANKFQTGSTRPSTPTNLTTPWCGKWSTPAPKPKASPRASPGGAPSAPARLAKSNLPNPSPNPSSA
jgi:type I restriction enzyme R subunit